MRQYQRIEGYLRAGIVDGTWEEDAMLPTEEQLARQFGVSRPTVRQAMNGLVTEGLLRRISGRGTFVCRPKLVQESTRFIESYPEEMRKKGLIPKTSVLAMREELADAFIAARLGISPKTPVFYLKRLRHVVGRGEDRPSLLTEVWLPGMLAGVLGTHDFEQESLYAALAQEGLLPKRAFREIEARMPDRHEAALLEMPLTEPVQCVTSVGYLADGTIVEYARSLYPASRSKFLVEINR